MLGHRSIYENYSCKFDFAFIVNSMQESSYTKNILYNKKRKKCKRCSDLPSLLYHPYFVCIVHCMPSLHLFCMYIYRYIYMDE